jgi:hypothetical protein
MTPAFPVCELMVFKLNKLLLCYFNTNSFCMHLKIRDICEDSG